MSEKKVIGIKVIALVIAVLSARYLFWILMSWQRVSSFKNINPYMTHVVYSLNLGATLALLFGGIGLLSHKRWAHFVTIVGASLTLPHVVWMVVNLISHLISGSGFFVLAFLGWIWNFPVDILAIFLLYYLTRPTVKEQFKL